MPSEFETEYILFVFLSALGLLQYVAGRSGLHGLLFFRPRPRLSSRLGLLLLAAAFAWFFLDQNRNLPDTTLGLDGNQQARWFAIGGALAVAVTFMVSSMVNHRWGRVPDDEVPDVLHSGIDALRRTTIARAFILLAASLIRSRGRSRARAGAR